MGAALLILGVILLVTAGLASAESAVLLRWRARLEAREAGTLAFWFAVAGLACLAAGAVVPWAAP